MHYYEIQHMVKDPETGLIDWVSVTATDYNRAVCKFNAIGLHLCTKDDITLLEFERNRYESRCISVKHSWEYPDKKLPCVVYDSEEVA